MPVETFVCPWLIGATGRARHELGSLVEQVDPLIGWPLSRSLEAHGNRGIDLPPKDPCEKIHPPFLHFFFGVGP